MSESRLPPPRNEYKPARRTNTMDKEMDFLCALDITPPASPDRSRREKKLFLSEDKFEEEKRGWRAQACEGTTKERAERCYYLKDWRGAVEAVEEALGEERWGVQERVKEVKRGLEKWRSWRVDLASMGSSEGLGEVFEV